MKQYTADIRIIALLVFFQFLGGLFQISATELSPVLNPVFEKGAYRTYSIQYRDENTTTIFPDRLGKKGGNSSTFMSALSFDGDLRVKDYGHVDGSKVYSLSFDSVRSRHFALNGHDVFNNAPSFIDTYKNREVYVSLTDSNEIERFYFSGDTSQVFKTFMTTVAQEIQVAARNDTESWDVQEVNQHGKGRVNYQISGRKGDRIELIKTRKNYDYPGLIEKDDHQDIRTDETVILNTRGFVEEIDKREETKISSKNGNETILDVRKTLQLRLTGNGEFDPGDFGKKNLTAMQAIRPGDPIEDAEQNRELLAKRASYLSYEEIEGWVRGFKPDKTNNRSNNSMFYRVTGFVELHPKSAENLADFCTNRSKKPHERILVMNILAAVGNSHAQKAMRDILSHEGMKQDTRQYGVMVQNFSFVDQKPEPETVGFLKGMMNNNTGYVSYSAAHAYGASIHKLYQGTNVEKKQALMLNKELLKKISQAKNDDEKAEYIAAVGNAGMIENNELLFGYSKSGTFRVRMEAVSALRKTETPKCRSHVLSVFEDSERAVQRSAIQTFLHFSPDKNNLKGIKSKLERELIEEANFYDMVTLLKKNRQKYPVLVNDCLKIMIRKKLRDPDLEARIRGMII